MGSGVRRLGDLGCQEVRGQENGGVRRLARWGQEVRGLRGQEIRRTGSKKVERSGVGGVRKSGS